nr:hypothetical protein [Klebsiella pneumoniae]
MSLTKLLPVILLMMATGVQASTRDEIERLWNPQGALLQIVGGDKLIIPFC